MSLQINQDYAKRYAKYVESRKRGYTGIWSSEWPVQVGDVVSKEGDHIKYVVTRISSYDRDHMKVIPLGEGEYAEEIIRGLFGNVCVNSRNVDVDLKTGSLRSYNKRWFKHADLEARDLEPLKGYFNTLELEWQLYLNFTSKIDLLKAEIRDLESQRTAYRTLFDAGFTID